MLKIRDYRGVLIEVACACCTFKAQYRTRDLLTAYGPDRPLAEALRQEGAHPHPYSVGTLYCPDSAAATRDLHAIGSAVTLQPELRCEPVVAEERPRFRAVF